MKEKVEIPSVGESIVEGMLTAWLKKNDDFVKHDEDLYEFETEKASITVPSPFEGILEIIVSEGTKVRIGQVVAMIDTSMAAPAPKEKTAGTVPDKAMTAPVIAAKAETDKKTKKEEKKISSETLSPAAARIIKENDIDITGIRGTGKDGKITKGDALAAIKHKPEEKKEAEQAGAGEMRADESLTKKVPMSYLRKAIASRMLTARHETAYLTTFNEINMEKVIEIRKTHQEYFQKKYGIKLGFMSFFVKASVEALKAFPVINARIEGEDIVYYSFYDIGIAVSTDRGLLVPVIRNADTLTFAELEDKIADLAESANNKKITLPELLGGTFTITNGGVFGSLMSTPIPNHPQPAILGMHAIQERPVAIKGEVKIKPMMYVALSYDHRLIDGKEAVSFLVRIKEYIEDPEEMFLNI